jgi:hypothetical protein
MAGAQAPPPASQNPVCARLENQLNALDRGGADQTRLEQLRRLEDAANKQQFELDRLIAQSRREGCGSGFFLFGGQPAQCGQINGQVQQARAALDRIHADIDRLRQPGAEREGQRRSLLIALAQNDCGPQYRQQAAAAQPRGFFETLFGGLPIFGNNPIIAAPPPAGSPPLPGPAGSDFLPSGTYRTLCVRMCDGFYFPISFSTAPSRFREDEQVCRRTCPAAEVALYVHRNPGEDVNQAVSLTGQPYTELPNAFLYRKELVSTCGCRRPGESWAQALKYLDSRATIEAGDILVDDQRAKQLSQPRVDAQGRPIRIDPRARTATGATADAPVVEGSEKPDPSRKVRSVGPTFLPGR